MSLNANKCCFVYGCHRRNTSVHRVAALTPGGSHGRPCSSSGTFITSIYVCDSGSDTSTRRVMGAAAGRDARSNRHNNAVASATLSTGANCSINHISINQVRRRVNQLALVCVKGSRTSFMSPSYFPRAFLCSPSSMSNKQLCHVRWCANNVEFSQLSCRPAET
jgi:hypothetical protein